MMNNKHRSRRRQFLTGIGAGAVATLSGCLSRLFQFTGPESDDVDLRWETELEGDIRVPPILSDNFVYVTARDDYRHGYFYAIERDSGDVRWRSRIDTSTPLRWVLVEKMAYVAGITTIWAFDLDTQGLAWENDNVESVYSPVFLDDHVYVSERDGGVVVLDQASGDVIETIDVPQATRSAIIPYEESYILATADPPEHSAERHDSGHVRRLDAATFEQEWAQEVSPTPRVTLAPDGEQVVVGGDMDAVTALDPADGTEQWATPIGPDLTRPTLDEDTAYVGAMDGTLYALDLERGHERWTFDEPGGLLSFDDAYSSRAPLVVADERVYAPSTDENLYVLDRSDGTLRWQFRAGESLYQPPAIDDGAVFLAGTDGTVYAIDHAR